MNSPLILPNLPLEARPVEKFFHHRHLVIRNGDHQVQVPFPCASGYRSAADMFDAHPGEMLANQGGDQSGDHSGLGIVLSARCWAAEVAADDGLNVLEHCRSRR